MNQLARLFESTETPLRTADHAARFVWFTDNNPRAAASFGAVVNRLNRAQSLVGWVSARPAQEIQPSVSPWSFWAWDFRYIVCHGVPRCTRPSQPMLGNLFVGKSQSSDCVIKGSLTAKAKSNGPDPGRWLGFPPQGL